MEEIKINDRYIIQNIKMFKNGYRAGHILADLVEYGKKIRKVGFRVHNPSQGEDYTLEYVNYGWSLDDYGIIDEVELKLIEYAKKIDIDFLELERNQIKL